MKYQILLRVKLQNLYLKNKYDNFSKIYDNLKLEEKIKKLGKYQENISSVVDIDIPKSISNKDFISLINILQKANIIFCKMEVKG